MFPHLALIVAFSTLDSNADSRMHAEEEEPTVSALAVQRARLLIITVDDLNDCSGKAACSKARCQMVPASDAAPAPAGTGSCTLRAALDLANTIRSDQAATLMLRAGRFRLASPLPKVSVTLQLVGSSGDSPAVPPEHGGGDGAGPTADELDTWDAVYEGGDAGGHQGQTSAIRTILDGGSRHQILQVSATGALHLRTLRLENGRARGQPTKDAISVVVEASGTSHDESSHDETSHDESEAQDGASNAQHGAPDALLSLGGALNNRGKLVLTNVALRGNVAVYGGAIYSEGELEVHHALIEHNEATHCGGGLYAASGGKAHFFHSTLRYNSDQCNRRTASRMEPGMVPRYALGGSAAAPQLGGSAGAAGALATAPLGPGGGGGGGFVDSSGAIAEGPPLSTSSVPNEGDNTPDDARDGARAWDRGMLGRPRELDRPPPPPPPPSPPPPPPPCEPRRHGGRGGELQTLRCGVKEMVSDGAHDPAEASRLPVLPVASAPFVVGIYGRHGHSFLNAVGLLCSDGTRTPIAPSDDESANGEGAVGDGQGAVGGGAVGFEWVCPGWEAVHCVDTVPHCASWASTGECTANPAYMHAMCAASCKKCGADKLDTSVEVPATPSRAAAATGLAVRAGDLVDAVQLQCGTAGASFLATGESAVLEPKLSPWFGGGGGSLCLLACEAGAAGGEVAVLRELSIRAGGLVDSMEVGCAV